jgi:hypothetical protein
MRSPLRDTFMQQGQVLGLECLPLRTDGPGTERLIGYWAAGAHELWWVATSETGPSKDVLAL